MEKVETQIPIEKLPHLQITQKSIDEFKNFVVLLNKRKELARVDFNKLTAFEQNEREILLVRTETELAKTHTNIVQREMYFKDYLKNVTTYYNEMLEKWDALMVKAKTKSGFNKQIAEELEKADEKLFEENVEYKINHYIRIKMLVYPNKADQTMKPVK